MGIGLRVLERAGEDLDHHHRLLARTKQRLSEAEAASLESPGSQLGVLEDLADQLLAMRAKGFAHQRLVSILAQCGISIGVDGLDAFLKHAWMARMYACEQQISEHCRRGNAVNLERAGFIERGLRQALREGNGLALHYQPQVDMGTGAVVGAEALLRWHHGSDLISPTEFIPVAEESSLIQDLGAWVLHEACREAMRWQRLGLGQGRGIKVAVNLSVKQFTERLPGVVHGALCDAGLRVGLLGLEITESFLAEDRTEGLLHSLHDAGLHLSIDDFGTGYSCLSRVSKLPLDTIKIDRAFVTDLGRSPGAAAVVETIIGMAAKLSMTTVAEGVETQRQADLLKELGCAVAQGQLFAKPLPADQFIAFAMKANRD